MAVAPANTVPHPEIYLNPSSRTTPTAAKPASKTSRSSANKITPENLSIPYITPAAIAARRKRTHTPSSYTPASPNCGKAEYAAQHSHGQTNHSRNRKQPSHSRRSFLHATWTQELASAAFCCKSDDMSRKVSVKKIGASQQLAPIWSECH